MSSDSVFTDQQLQKAVALFYDGNTAPRVTAKGSGDQARQIMALAEEHNIPLCDNEALVELLMALELGENIPEALYTAIAHIIAFAYQLQDKTPPGWQS